MTPSYFAPSRNINVVLTTGGNVLHWMCCQRRKATTPIELIPSPPDQRHEASVTIRAIHVDAASIEPTLK